MAALVDEKVVDPIHIDEEDYEFIAPGEYKDALEEAEIELQELIKMEAKDMRKTCEAEVDNFIESVQTFRRKCELLTAKTLHIALEISLQDVENIKDLGSNPGKIYLLLVRQYKKVSEPLINDVINQADVSIRLSMKLLHKIQQSKYLDQTFGDLVTSVSMLLLNAVKKGFGIGTLTTLSDNETTTKLSYLGQLWLSYKPSLEGRVQNTLGRIKQVREKINMVRDDSKSIENKKVNIHETGHLKGLDQNIQEIVENIEVFKKIHTRLKSISARVDQLDLLMISFTKPETNT